MMGITGMLLGCSLAEQGESQPSVTVKEEPLQQNIVGRQQEFLLDLKEEVKNGHMKGIELSLGSTYQDVVKKYGEPKGIQNDE